MYVIVIVVVKLKATGSVSCVFVSVCDHLHTRFHMHSFSGLLVIAVKLTAKENILTLSVLLFFILQKVFQQQLHIFQYSFQYII
jgi:hypothetical protein